MTSDDQPQRPHGVLTSLLWVILIVSAAGFLWTTGRSYFAAPLHDPAAAPRALTARGDLAADEQATIELFQRTAPSVVHITTLERRRTRSFFGGTSTYVGKGTGSGIVWDGKGYIVTNYHVIAGADRAVVVLSDGSEHDARLVGYAANFDLAVLLIDTLGRDLTPLALGSSQGLLVGQKVFAIGNPFGLDHTLTTGVISGVDRQIESIGGGVIQGVIQTDAAINPGNSGGPLLDSAGRLIGINTAIKSTTGSSSGIGFAVPVDTVNRMVPELVRRGHSGKAMLGVNLADDRIVRSYGLVGAVVTSVVAGSSAEACGLLAPEGDRVDIIVGLNGRPIRSGAELREKLSMCAVGEEVELEVVRGNKRLKTRATLGAMRLSSGSETESR